MLLWRFRRARSQETPILLWLNRGMPKLLWLQVEKNQASLVETKENPKKRPCLLGKSQETPILYWREPRKAEEHTSELQSRENLVCRLLLEKKKNEVIKHKQSRRLKETYYD